MVRDRARHVERAVQVHVDHVVPIRPAHAVEDTVAEDAGVVDENVDVPKGIDRRLHDRLGILGLGDRERRYDGLAAGLLDVLDGFLRRPLIAAGAVQRGAEVDHYDAGTLLRHQHRDGAPNAASRAGDDRDFPFDVPSHAFPAPFLARRYDQTSFATSTIMRSLAHCWSSLNRLPSSVEAKPHCGERQSWSSATYFVASSMRRLISSFFSNEPSFEDTRPSTICLLPLG